MIAIHITYWDWIYLRHLIREDAGRRLLLLSWTGSCEDTDTNELICQRWVVDVLQTQVVAEEELLKADSKGDNQEAELLILDEFAVLCRDLYAFYPMLIRYVDINRYNIWKDFFDLHAWVCPVLPAFLQFLHIFFWWGNTAGGECNTFNWWLQYNHETYIQ